jgi:hypothetical protein
MESFEKKGQRPKKPPISEILMLISCFFCRSVATSQHIAVVFFAKNGRFSGPTKDGFMIFDSYNLKKLSSIEPSIFVWSVLLMEAVYIIHPAC